MTDPMSAPVSAVDKALIAFAQTLTLRPSETTKADLDTLRALGLSDRAIHDAVQVIALFAYYNRVADGLGVEVTDDPPMP